MHEWVNEWMNEWMFICVYFVCFHIFFSETDRPTDSLTNISERDWLIERWLHTDWFYCYRRSSGTKSVFGNSLIDERSGRLIDGLKTQLPSGVQTTREAISDEEILPRALEKSVAIRLCSRQGKSQAICPLFTKDCIPSKNSYPPLAC